MLEQLSRERFQAVAKQRSDGLELDLAGLGGLPPALMRRVLFDALRQVSGGREVGLEHVESVMAVVEARHGGVDVPGSRAQVHGRALVLVQQKGSVR